MEDRGSKKRRIPQTTATLAKKKKQRMAGNAPVQCRRSRAVVGKDDQNNRNTLCFDGSKKVMKPQTAQLSMIYDNVGCSDVEKTIRAEKLKERFADVILKAKLLLNGKAPLPCTERPRRALSLAPRPSAVPCAVQEKQASRPAIISGILRQRLSVKTELRREIQRKREAARTELQNMKRTADFAENLDALKELRRVFGCSPWVMEAFHGARRENPLEKLGLFLKDTSIDEGVEADMLDREGEIY